MSAQDTVLGVDWLGVSRRATEGVADVLRSAATTAQRVAETGTTGEGGDRTLVIDDSAEEAVFSQLRAVHDAGHRFQAMSEERGEVDFGGDAVRVVIDPIDGSLNAKRRASHYALSLAVADGPTMADVRFAFVYDFGAREEWWAADGQGAWLDGARLDPAVGERRWHDGTLEVVGIESASPGWVGERIERLGECAHRLRALGTIAVTLCQVAAARYDGMLTLARSRGVDCAAGQLIVREAGGLVAFPHCADSLGAPLDARAVSRIVAARSADGLSELARVAL